jgi:hypothetical protein
MPIKGHIGNSVQESLVAQIFADFGMIIRNLWWFLPSGVFSQSEFSYFCDPVG